VTNLEYRAIRKAARTIERNKARYNFFRTARPESERDKGCVLGWIGYYLDLQTADHDFADATAAALGLKPNHYSIAAEVFYQALDRFDLGDELKGWRDDNKLAAKALRLYADKYYLTEKETA
jgi:hypothetical protein